jgi:hypothetical protein
MKSRCPTEEELADYLENRATAAEKGRLEDHVASCRSCFDEFVSSRVAASGAGARRDHVPESVTLATLERLRQKGLLGGAPQESPVLGRVREMGRRLTGFLGFSPRDAALAPVRGSRRIVREGFVEVRKTFRDLGVVIEIEKLSSRRVNINVSFPDEDGGGEPIRITLVKNGRDAASMLFTGREPVVFDGVPFGAYGLSFFRGRTPAGEYHFEIRE